MRTNQWWWTLAVLVAGCGGKESGDTSALDPAMSDSAEPCEPRPDTSDATSGPSTTAPTDTTSGPSTTPPTTGGTSGQTTPPDTTEPVWTPETWIPRFAEIYCDAWAGCMGAEPCPVSIGSLESDYRGCDVDSSEADDCAAEDFTCDPFTMSEACASSFDCSQSTSTTETTTTGPYGGL